MELKIAQQGAETDSHIEVGVQIELVAGKNTFLGARPAADASVAFEHGDAHAGTHKISGEGQAVVARANHNAVEICHVAPLCKQCATQRSASIRGEQRPKNCRGGICQENALAFSPGTLYRTAIGGTM